MVKVISWGDKGTITWRIAPDFRLVLMESDLFNAIFTRLKDYLGISIRNLVFEAQRNNAAASYKCSAKEIPHFVGTPWSQ